MEVDGSGDDSSWSLSTELLPEHEGGVQAVAALSDDIIVSGGDDHQVFIWQRDGPGARTFHAACQIADHQHNVRAIMPLPPSALLPTGGFVTGCLDKSVRIYSVQATPTSVSATLVKTLTGHLSGVISLSLTSLGQLVSGGWEGHVRVWDLTTGKCQVLEGHENGTCVVGLPNGDIAVGSTGRKSADNKHVDYKLRIWKMSGHGDQRAYSIASVIEDHRQAVRDVALLPGGAGFVSVGNDGCVIVRDLAGKQLTSFTNPASSEDKPFSAFRVAVLPSVTAGTGPHLVTANEDEVVRVINLATGEIEAIKHPGE